MNEYPQEVPLLKGCLLNEHIRHSFEEIQQAIIILITENSSNQSVNFMWYVNLTISKTMIRNAKV